MRIGMLTALLVFGSVLAPHAQPAPSLKIVVLEGEDAVNIIQQTTAVRALVEVRDRNNLPVAGASVTFTIGGGQGAAFAAGAQTLTVTTNAAGQAVASGLNAVSSGAFQIQVQAAYQGQVATAAISQTNFATAAAATQAGASGGGASATSGAAAGGGGGISTTTIAIAGAAIGGGALVATQALGKTDDDGSSGDQVADVYTGPLTGQLPVVTVTTNAQGQSNSCTRTMAVTGSLSIQLTGGGAGTARGQVNQNELSLTGNCIPSTQTTSFALADLAVTGGPSTLTFTNTVPVGAFTYRVAFNGSLAGNTITGTFALEVVQGGTGVTRLPVTLLK